MSGAASEHKITKLFEEVERLQERLTRLQRENIGSLTSAIGRVRAAKEGANHAEGVRRPSGSFGVPGMKSLR